MAKLYTEEMKALIDSAEVDSFQGETGGDVIINELNKAFNRGVTLMAKALKAKLANHDYEELVNHDQR